MDLSTIYQCKSLKHPSFQDIVTRIVLLLAVELAASVVAEGNLA
jgi:hypothetical protein